ncbi:MAG TPA: OmpA family protein [Polyangiaceae bacterium]|nr:OmpA family protein [Polyangiaceae bacterium]
MRSPALGLQAWLALLLAASVARAEPSVSLELSKPPAGDRAFLVAGADARGAGVLRARLGADYAFAPLVVLDADQLPFRVVSHQLRLEPGVSFALAHRVLLSLDVPVVLAEAGEMATVPSAGDAAASETLEPGSAPALGDVHLGARARLLGNADSPVKLAAGAELWFPAASEPWAGDGAFRAKPALTTSAESARLRGALELGFLVRTSERVPSLLPLRTSSALVFGIATAAALDSGGELFVGPEMTLALGVADGAKLFDPRSTSGQALLGARYVPNLGPIVVALGAGPGFGQAPGAADFRVLASVSFSPEAPPPLPDGDDDRVPDERDACPSVPGSPSEDPLMNGCPELPTDTDGDAIPDILDACPRTPGPANVERRLHGCPPPKPSETQPPAPPPTVEIVRDELTLAQQVQFETGTAVLRSESDPILTDVVRLLAEHPDIESVEVQGHTDETGTVELNRRLSEERARSVVAWLVQHGVARERVVAKGYGKTQPIADNSTEEGRAKNRRVVFRILRRKGAPPPEETP